MVQAADSELHTGSSKHQGLVAQALTDPASAEERLAVDVRVVLFSVDNGALRVALSGDGAGFQLPRGVPQASVNLDAEARRILRDATGCIDQYIEQLYTLGVDSDDRWTVVVSYLALVAPDGGDLGAPGCEWIPASDVPMLARADQMVLDYALVRLRAKTGYTTIAFRLLPSIFTLRELQDVYEAILGHPVDKRNFRRRVTAAAPIEATGERRRDGSHRPAELFRYLGDHAEETYLTPSWAAGAGTR
jgi:8-oxo-dGTP diphosphatase